MAKKTRIGILSIMFLFLVFLGVGSIAHADTASADTIHYYGVVKEGPLNVRSGPATSYTALGKISVGTKITITSTVLVNNVKWYRFSYQSKAGYVCGKYIKVYASQKFYSVPKPATVFNAPLNVRSGPGSSYSVIGSAQYLKVVYVKSLYYRYGSEKWLRITWNGQKAFLSAKYVLVNTAGSTIKKYSSSIDRTITTSTPIKSGPGLEYAGTSMLSVGKKIQCIGELLNPKGEKWLVYRHSYDLCYIRAKDTTVDLVSGSTNAQKIVSLAYSKMGCDYVYGAEGPNSFDCSGFVYWVVNNSSISGLTVPRTSIDLYTKYKAYNVGTNIANAKPGDIILFSDNGAASGICHSAIYYKDGKMIHASSPDTGVILTTVSYSTTNKSVFAIIRLPGL